MALHRGPVATLLLSAAVATATAPALGAKNFEPIAHIEEGVNFAGAVIGRVPEFWGSRDNALGVAPMARWQLDGERFVQWLGAEVTVNVLNHRHWRAGPSLGVRFGRREVSDPVVRAMRPVASTGELGAFVGYTEPLGADPRHRWGFSVALAGATGSVYSGLYGSASAYWLKPLAPWFTLNASGGVGFAGSGFQRAYFGVSPADAPLFSGLDAAGYRPGAGLTDVRMLAGGMVHLSLNWHVLAGLRAQRLLGDSASSPIVRQRGNATQWVAGAGLVYLWR
ncbi:MAG: MipA/OmpV family protein [Betaproteobacteria bacterium]|jgi:outer membrane protein|nr:MipA/OmpV family protein [Rubrivivax sp.]